MQTENMRNEQQQTINIKEIFRESNLKSECNFQKSKMPGAQEARAKASGEHVPGNMNTLILAITVVSK